MRNRDKILFFLCFFMIFSVLAFSDDLPSVKYVASKDGLNKREFPTLTSKKLGTLLYGTRVIAHERTNEKETIEGVTDYWYRCSGGGGFYWVFGGYLSDSIPEDTEPVLGYWNTDRGEKYYWYFRPDNTVSSGRKETDTGWTGSWTLQGNRLTIITIPTEFNTGNSETMEITITVINHDKIIFSFPNGNNETLIRNYNIF